MARRPNAHRLKVLTDTEIKDALEYQKEKTNWDFYSERELMEGIINQRINFVIAVFALFITAAVTVDDPFNLRIVLSLGAFLILMLIFNLWRLDARLDIILKILYKAEKKHVLPMVQQEVNAMGWKAFFQTTKLVNIWIPVFCLAIMIFGVLLSWIGWIKP